MNNASGNDFPNRRAYVALLLTLLALTAALAGTDYGMPGWPAGVAAWSAGALLWPGLARAQKQQSLWLAGIGMGGFVLTIALGGRPMWGNLLTQNSALLGMLVSVSFLQMLAPPPDTDRGLPRGKGALWRTMLGVHILGSVINLSAVFMMAERIGPKGKPTQEQAVALVRAFLAAATWSPFFAATAVALTYAPGANPLRLALIGASFAGVLLVLGGRDIIRQMGNDTAGFVGYPLRPSALYIPVLLAALVAVGHWFFPRWTALSIISIASLLVVCVLSVFRNGPLLVCRAITSHAHHRLPSMAGEVILFLAAGTLASGLTSLIGMGDVWLPFTRFGALEAAAVLAVMILLAIIGVHTVISITMVGTWLAPLHPEPLLLALVFVQSWAIGLAAGPMSGINLAIQGRYGIASSLLAKLNLRYCAQAYCAAVIWLTMVCSVATLS
ncbi:MAG: hypothetical protein RIQ55_826 [Pseudomonadota bacterium]